MYESFFKVKKFNGPKKIIYDRNLSKWIEGIYAVGSFHIIGIRHIKKFHQLRMLCLSIWEGHEKNWKRTTSQKSTTKHYYPIVKENSSFYNVKKFTILDKISF